MTAEEAPKQQIRLLIHKTVVGAIIGRNGDVIKSIAEGSGANITIEQCIIPEQRLNELIKDRVLKVSFSNLEQLSAAIVAIAPILRQSREHALRELSSPKQIPEGEQLFTALLHRGGVSRLLSDEGKIMKTVQIESGAHIRIRDLLPQSSESSIQFKGSLFQVSQAILSCTEALCDRSGEGVNAYRPYHPSLPIVHDDPIKDQTLTVKTADIPFIIGREGRRSKDITQKTSCRVKIADNSEDNNGQTKIVIRGPSRNLSLAAAMIFRSRDLADRRKRNFEDKQ